MTSQVGIVETSEPIIVSVDNGIITQSSHQPHLSPSTRERGLYKLFFSNPYLAAFSFLIMYLLGVVQEINQDNGTGASLFHAHPANLKVFIISTVIFTFASATAMALSLGTSNPLPTRIVAFFSGALSVGSVQWMFLPPWLGWFLLIIWFLLLVMVGCDLLRHSFQMIYQKTKEKLLVIYQKTKDAFNRLSV